MQLKLSLIIQFFTEIRHKHWLRFQFVMRKSKCKFALLASLRCTLPLMLKTSFKVQLTIQNTNIVLILLYLSLCEWTGLQVKHEMWNMLTNVFKKSPHFGISFSIPHPVSEFCTVHLRVNTSARCPASLLPAGRGVCVYMCVCDCDGGGVCLKNIMLSQPE